MANPQKPIRKSAGVKRDRSPTRGSDDTARPRTRPQKKPGRHRAGTTDNLYLYGLHTVRAALDNPRRKIAHLYMTENAAVRLGDPGSGRNEVPVDIKPAHYLDQLVGSEAVHQGVVAKCVPLDVLDASELFHLADAQLILALDQITDPHNAGAILRSASAIGADAVLTTSRNSARETAVLAKSASGALDTIRLVELRNLSKSLRELSEMGFVTIGLDSEGPLVLEKTLSDNQAKKVVLVLGSESKGLRQMTRETCQALARLDMPGPIKSLNVSNAATLSLYVVANHLSNRSR
jgi:23S rRNA (guanosine2251-2'-O)-methyltransferase